MKKEELMNTLSEEARQKLAACKTQEEAKKILTEAGVEPLDDELLDSVTGGEMLSLDQLFAQMQAESQARQQTALREGASVKTGTTAPADQEYLKGILTPSERPPHA